VCVLRRCRYTVDSDDTTKQAGGDEPHRRPRGRPTDSLLFPVLS